MRNPPLEVIRTWPKPNFVDPENRGISLQITLPILIVISFIIVSMRLYVRTRILHTAGIDDWLIGIALLPVTGMTAGAWVGTRFGWGIHVWDNKPEWTSPSLLVSWVNQLLFVIAVTFVKLSICYSYRRLSQDKNFHTLLNATKIVLVLWGVVFSTTLIFRCWPPQAYWADVQMRQEECMDEAIVMLFSSVANLVTDIWLVALPLPTLYRLKLPFKQRIILMILMSLGVVACAASIVRFYYLYKTLVTTYDVTWEGYNIWLWTAVEVDLSLITASVPPLRPLVRKYFPRLIDTNKSFTNGDVSVLPELDRDDTEGNSGNPMISLPIQRPPPGPGFNFSRPYSEAVGLEKGYGKGGVQFMQQSVV